MLLNFASFFIFIFSFIMLCTPQGNLFAQKNAKLKRESPDFRVQLTTATKGYDGKTCWVHARAGAIPVGAPGNDLDNPLVVMTMQKLLLSGSDIFYALNSMRTDDLGKIWQGPIEQNNLSRHHLPDGGEVVVSDFWPQWHAASKTLLGIGHTVRYYNNRIVVLQQSHCKREKYSSHILCHL